MDSDDANQKKKKEFSWEQWEAPVITKYDKGVLFSSHNDASPTRGSEWSNLGGQRIAAVISYLNTCPSCGGGAKFDSLNFVVQQPRAGDALVFYLSDWDTLEADVRTVDQSLPAVEERYIVQLLGRCGSVPPPPKPTCAVSNPHQLSLLSPSDTPSMSSVSLSLPTVLRSQWRPLRDVARPMRPVESGGICGVVLSSS